MNTPRSLLALCLAAMLGAASLPAQVNLSSLTPSGDTYTYTENFNITGVTSTTTITGAWTNNSQLAYTANATPYTKALPGWFLSMVSDPTVPTYDTSGTARIGSGGAGNSTATGLLGATFSHATATLNETALALRNTAATQSALGFVIKNDTATAVDTITLAYTGEQWRRENSAQTNTLEFQYKVVSSFTAASYNVWAETGWSDLNTLDFTSPTVGATTGANLDGNQAANRSLKSAALPVTLDSGDYLLVRWFYSDADTQNVPGHALGIDDLSLSMVAAIPEPSTYAAIFGALALGAVAVIRRRGQR
ncbi:MAG: PEP-CTERM sorting domain-containing protein [Candidatus Didemnitutus sp.]|nr:PEP-CTERM sorting domain-containing protein [Candidatus Didemnitutus sp.]